MLHEVSHHFCRNSATVMPQRYRWDRWALMARKPQYRWPWAKVRLEILERDGHRCQINGPHCEVVATHVDHITPVARGGARLDHANLRASCATCNLELSNLARRSPNVPSRAW